MKRRDFIWKTVGLAGLATAGCTDSKLNIFIPKQSLDDYLQRYTPIVEDIYNNNQTPSQFLYNSMLSDGQGVSLDYSRNDGSRVKNTMLASATDKGDVDNNSKTDIFDLLKLLNILSGREQPVQAADIDGNGKVNIFDLLDLLKILSGTYNTYLLKGQHFDNDTETGKKALLTINGQQYLTDSNGLFNIRRPKESQYLITARQTDDNNLTGFRTTENISGADYTNLNLFSVSYPTQENVTPELFKAFCEEANFRELWGYTGLKTMLKNSNKRFWVSSHHYSDGSTTTAEEQAYVKNLIENEIYPHLKEANRPQVYVEDPNKPETLPIHQNGIILLMPIYGGFYIGPMDENKDGILDWASVYLEKSGWNENYKGPIMEELLSALIGPNEISNYLSLTALQAYGAITEQDKKLINICQRYKPKEQIENILGM